MAAARSGVNERLRSYGPIGSIVGALLLVMLVLPSALNTPQNNPTTTPEYAPVPPSDEKNVPPVVGNVASFGLAAGASLPGGGNGGPAATPAGQPPGSSNLASRGKTPRTKRCTGSPPRQTEDEMAPPCVADFRGDNGGATYQGVSGEEVRVLFYAQGGPYLTIRGGVETPTPNSYVNLLDAPDPNEHIMVHVLRAWQQYFNDRYQAYGRFVHFWVYYSDPNSVGDIAARRADAVDNFARVKPFAIESMQIDGGGDDAYISEMARRGVLNFGSVNGQTDDIFHLYPGLVWSFQPSIDQRARLFTSFLCRRVIPFKTSFSGTVGQNGLPRRLGLLYTTDPSRTELAALTEQVRRGIKKCGGSFYDEQSFHKSPAAGTVNYGDDKSNAQDAAQAMATFRRENVTTVIWTGGYEASNPDAAASIGYFPEWIVSGDRQIGTTADEGQNQQEWANAWVVTHGTYFTQWPNEACFQAYREVDTDLNQTDVINYACRYNYDDIRQLFIGIQVAGPRLTPSSVDQGFHAIPRISSTNPRVPACFYEPNDYSCVKDAIAEWWDPNGGTQGCWKMPENGKRYRDDEWTDTDVPAVKGANDVCNRRTPHV